MRVLLTFSSPVLLWAEHLELIGEESMLTVARHLGHQRQRRSVDEQAARLLQHLEETIGDPLVGLQLMIERAQDNLLRFHARQPLKGHLLPYVTGEEAKQQGCVSTKNTAGSKRLKA